MSWPERDCKFIREKKTFQKFLTCFKVSSSDNKTATYALMDKNNFGRERYRLGHTLVFFRAGALAYLEELRDELVIKWVRMIQGEVLKRVRGRVFEKKRDQRLV